MLRKDSRITTRTFSVRCDAMRCGAVRCGAMRCDEIRYSSYRASNADGKRRTTITVQVNNSTRKRWLRTPVSVTRCRRRPCPCRGFSIRGNCKQLQASHGETPYRYSLLVLVVVSSTIHTLPASRFFASSRSPPSARRTFHRVKPDGEGGFVSDGTEHARPPRTFVIGSLWCRACGHGGAHDRNRKNENPSLSLS